MKNSSNIIVTGSMSWDIIMDFPHQFVDYVDTSKLHELNLNFVLSNLEKQMGGTATNIAYGVSQTNAILRSKVKVQSSPLRQGFEGQANLKVKTQKLNSKVFVMGGLGKDGKEHVAFLKKNNIDTKGIVFDKTRFSASGSVITDIKNNQIWGFYYGACDMGKDVRFEKIVKQNDVMIISANQPQAFLAAQKYAIAHDVTYMYDVGMALGWIKDGDLKRGISHAKWLIGNDYEMGTITKRLEKPVSWIVSQGVDVITTLGEKGVIYESKVKGQRSKLKSESQNSKVYSVPVPGVKVKKTIDPTGAGDAWRGGFIAAYCAGQGIEDCLRMGNAVASFAVETYGTINYKLKVTELRKRLKQIKIKS